MEKTSIKSLTISELEDFVLSHKQPKFRTTQLLEWLYSKNVSDFNSMTNLPKTFLDELSSNFVITHNSIKDKVIASDRTTKYIIELPATTKNTKIAYIEAVAIPSKDKWTLCISTQVGCPMSCEFCATGKQGFSRNLTVGEIVEQIILVENDLESRISNVVVMGQGEPFLNLENLESALHIINNNKLLGIGARKITVSTCGIIPGINKFAKIDKQFGLAISLHSAIQETRDDLMPGVKNYKLNQLKDSIKDYIKITNRRPTFEYLMLNGINDTQEHLKALVEFCNGMLCHVNLIAYNKTEGDKYSASSKNTINA